MLLFHFLFVQMLQLKIIWDKNDFQIQIHNKMKFNKIDKQNEKMK